MYDRNTTCNLFTTYCESGKPEDLEKLIGSCAPLIRVVVSKYPQFIPYQEDIEQDVMVKMWMVFKNIERMRKELINPWAFITLNIGANVWKTMCRCAKVYDISMTLSDREKEIIDMRDNGKASWETIAKCINVELPETARDYYYIARQKEMRRPMVSFDDPTFVEKSGDESLDPARRYELKDLNRYWKKEMFAAIAKHPNADRLKDAFEKHVDLLFENEIEMEDV